MQTFLSNNEYKIFKEHLLISNFLLPDEIAET